MKKTGTHPKLSGNKMKEFKTFTYFIPAPPHRKNGYREKEFDKMQKSMNIKYNGCGFIKHKWNNNKIQS